MGADNRGDNGPNANGLCFKCHNPNTYANRNGSGTTGFFNGDRGNLHAFHTDKIERIRCNWCHVAVPHGWKNKALLVNLNDVGPEAGRAGNEEWRMNASAPGLQPGALLPERQAEGAQLRHQRQLGRHQLRLEQLGRRPSAPTATTRTNGKDWMRDVCSNPP